MYHKPEEAWNSTISKYKYQIVLFIFITVTATQRKSPKYDMHSWRQLSYSMWQLMSSSTSSSVIVAMLLHETHMSVPLLIIANCFWFATAICIPLCLSSLWSLTFLFLILISSKRKPHFNTWRSLSSCNIEQGAFTVHIKLSIKGRENKNQKRSHLEVPLFH